MNETKKNELISKKIIKNSILKYSNISLFERREKNYKSERKVRKAPKLFKTTKFLQKKVDETKENFLFPFYKTMSSFHFLDKSSTILPLLDIFEIEISKQKKNRYKTLFNKLNSSNKNGEQYNSNSKEKISKTANNFYLTETSIISKENNYQIRTLPNAIKKDKKEDYNINTLLLIQSKRKKENNINNKLRISGYLSNKKKSRPKYYYSFIKNESNKNNFDRTIGENEMKRIMDTKISKYIYFKKPKFKEVIEKTQELKIQNYAAKIKKERAIRLEEGYYNQIEFYQDTIQSLKSAQKLLDVQFSNKIADYTRFVMSKREREKVKSSKLIQEKINYMKDIDHIKNRINKIEVEKSNIIKWIYFMIQMKEKKLVLPNYYRNILEMAESKRISKRQISRREDKKDFHNRSKSRKKSSRKPSFFQMDSSIFNKDSNKDISNDQFYEINNIITQNNVNKRKEYEKIMNYKNNLIFQTPEEFQERLSSFEKENILLLKYYNELYHQLFHYKKELNLYIIDENYIKSKNLKIKEKEKEVEDIKGIIKLKMKIISDFKKAEENLENEFKKERGKNKSNKTKKKSKEKKIENNIDNNEEDKMPNTNKNTLLYRKISNIFEECKTVGSKLKFALYIISLINKKIYSKEKEMTLMLEFIEQTIDYLINNFNYYLNKNEEIQNFIKEVKSDIEKEHKIEKARIQMMNDLQRIKLLKEKVERRSNKIYFLPSKKIDLSKFIIKKEKKIVDKDSNKTPTIEDYLYNEKDIEDK